jgi:Type II secretion system (T2SS), protein E, N-terminal domain
MNCRAIGCTARLTWFRDRILKRPGYYLQSEWFCSENCLEGGVLQKLEGQSGSKQGGRSLSLQMTLANALISKGVITPAQLAGRTPNGDLSEHLLAKGLVKERDISLALSRIHNVPLINLNGRTIQSKVLNTVPAEIVKTNDFFPLEFLSAENRLVLVTCKPASVPVMVNLRGILGCQVAIYLSEESVVRTMIEQYCEASARSRNEEKRERPAASDNLGDVASRIVRRARAIGAQSLRVTRFGQFIWTRFFVGEEALNLVL